MRWEALFGDLEATADEAERSEFEAEVTERARAEIGAVLLGDRLAAQLGTVITCGTADGESVSGKLADVGSGWFRITSGREELLITAAGSVWIDGLGPAASVRADASRRQRLSGVLRGLARDRCRVRVRLLGGLDLVGRVDRVAADHIDLRPTGGRDESAPSGARVIPLAAVLLVRWASSEATA